MPLLPTHCLHKLFWNIIQLQGNCLWSLSCNNNNNNSNNNNNNGLLSAYPQGGSSSDNYLS